MKPSTVDIARALRYVTHEFTLADGRISGEHLAEGFAFGRCEPDRWEIEDAIGFASEWSDDVWASILARADEMRAEQGLGPIAAQRAARALGAVGVL